MDLKKTKTVFWCCGFQSFRNSLDKGGLYCSWLSSAADLPVKDTLEDFWLTTANTINPGGDISHVPRISCYRQHRGASTVTVNLPAASQSSRILRIAEYLSLDILFWLEYLCHTDGNASASSSLTFLVRVLSVKPQLTSGEQVLLYNGRKRACFNVAHAKVLISDPDGMAETHIWCMRTCFIFLPTVINFSLFM